MRVALLGEEGPCVWIQSAAAIAGKGDNKLHFRVDF